MNFSAVVNSLFTLETLETFALIVISTDALSLTTPFIYRLNERSAFVTLECIVIIIKLRNFLALHILNNKMFINGNFINGNYINFSLSTEVNFTNRLF